MMDDLRPARGIGAAVAVSVGVMIVLWLLFEAPIAALTAWVVRGIGNGRVW